jgi:hypothetical protein
MAGSWRRWRKRHAGADEISLSDSAMMEGIAREFGLSVGELRNLAELAPGTADLLYQRLDALGIDRAAVMPAPLLRTDLERCCAQCTHKAECATDLDVGSASENWKTYCPNALTLASLRPSRPC